MSDPTDDPRRGERIAGDYQPSHSPYVETDNSDHARLARAAALLRSGRVEDGFGPNACARLLAVIGEARRREVTIDDDVLATAMAICANVLEFGPDS